MASKGESRIFALKRTLFCVLVVSLSSISNYLSADESGGWVPRTFYNLFGGIAGESISSRVIDANTGKPLANVAVLYYLHSTSWHGAITGTVAAVEAETDEKGWFTLPAWGPQLSSISNRNLSENPVIKLFKPGYEFGSLGEKSVLSHGVREIDRMKISSSWHGKTIELKPVSEITIEYISSASSNMASIVGMSYRFSDGALCSWELFPINVKAFMEARALFISKGMNPVMMDYEEESKKKCRN